MTEPRKGRHVFTVNAGFDMGSEFEVWADDFEVQPEGVHFVISPGQDLPDGDVPVFVSHPCIVRAGSMKADKRAQPSPGGAEWEENARA